MKKTTTIKSIRNIIIGLVLLGVSVYFIYLCIMLVNYSLERTFIIDDAVRTGWNDELVEWFNQTKVAENAFIKTSVIAQVVTSIPVIGKIAFIVVTFLLSKLSYEIIRCNVKHLIRNLAAE